MTGKWKEVVRLNFKGKRFRDHALDIIALGELQQFQKMVEETAKTLWRKAHPDRDRLPKHFEERTRLCLRKIEEGSAVLPLEVPLDDSEQLEMWEKEPVEVKEAIDLAYSVYSAIHDDTSIPDEFPKELLPEYARLGQGLSGDDVLEFSPTGKSATQVSVIERDRLISLAEQPYEDQVDITGRVLEADVRKRKFQIWIDDQTRVRVSFNEDQENKVTTALKDHKTRCLRVRGRGELTPQGTLKHIHLIDTIDLLREEEPEFDVNAPDIEDVINEIFRDVPEKEWNRLPQDLTDRLDYYLYGEVSE